GESAVFARDIAPFLKTYCNSCHSERRRRGKMSLETYKDDPRMSEDRKVWASVARALRAHDMPPEDKPQPKPEEIQVVTAWIDRQLAEVEKSGFKDPGR